MSVRAAASGAGPAFALKAGQTKVTKVKDLPQRAPPRPGEEARQVPGQRPHDQRRHQSVNPPVSKKITVKAPTKAKQSRSSRCIRRGQGTDRAADRPGSRPCSDWSDM